LQAAGGAPHPQPSTRRNLITLIQGEFDVMRKTRSLVTALATLSAVAALGACNSRESEQQADTMEEQADQVRDNADEAADSMENQADQLDTRADGVDSPAEQGLENQADAVRESAEAKADALEEQADQTRDAG
jgi:gas vesicle protein